MIVVIHFTRLTVSSILHFYTVCTFHCLSQFVLKIEYLHLSGESNVEIWSRRFFHLTYVEPKHQSMNITTLVQMISAHDLDIVSMLAISRMV